MITKYYHNKDKIVLKGLWGSMNQWLEETLHLQQSQEQNFELQNFLLIFLMLSLIVKYE